MTSDPTRQVADALRRHGLATPARLLVDAHRPLAPLLSDLGAALRPMTAGLPVGRRTAIADALSDERTLDRLLAELDATEEADARPE
jgi:hypothetical protein